MEEPHFLAVELSSDFFEVLEVESHKLVSQSLEGDFGGPPHEALAGFPRELDDPDGRLEFY